MKLTFDLKSTDFLTYQLFAASQTPGIQQKKRRGRIFLALGSLAFSVFFYIGNSLFLSIYFLVFAIGTYVFYPRYFKWRYHRHYQKHIRQHYENRLNVAQEVEILPDHIFLRDKTGEARILINEVEEVIEAPEHFFVKLSTGASLIFPKVQLDTDAVKSTFESLGLTIVDQRGWKW